MVAVFALAAFLPGIPAFSQEGRWGAGVSFFTATLEEENYGGGFDTDDLFDTGGGIDLHASYAWTPRVSQLFGLNSVGFDGDHSTDMGRTVETDDIVAGALYTGIDLHTERTEGWGVYGRFEIGLSQLDDVEHTVTQGGTQTTEESLEGGAGLYAGLGAGVSYGFTERLSGKLGVMWRRYGTLDDDNVPGRALATEQVEVAAGGLEIGVSYRF